MYTLYSEHLHIVVNILPETDSLLILISVCPYSEPLHIVVNILPLQMVFTNMESLLYYYRTYIQQLLSVRKRRLPFLHVLKAGQKLWTFVLGCCRVFFIIWCCPGGDRGREEDGWKQLWQGLGMAAGKKWRRIKKVSGGGARQQRFPTNLCSQMIFPPQSWERAKHCAMQHIAKVGSSRDGWKLAKLFKAFNFLILYV